MRHISHKSLSPLNPHTPQARKESPTVRQQANYHNLITNDMLEPARLFWVEREGEMVKRAWGELTHNERFFQNEADRRAAEIASFDPCGMEVF